MEDLDFDELDRAVNSLVTKKPVAPTPSQTQPEPSIIQPQPVATDSAVPAVAPTLAERRSMGRFMDVVHPSSDMRSNSVTLSRPNPSVAAPTAPVNQPVYTAPINNPAPAPIVNKPESDQEDYDDIDKISNEITNTINKSNESLESPFLSGAKVEKRPLGAFSSESPAVTTEPVTKDSVDNQVMDSGIGIQGDKINPPMPAELQADVLKIEADSTTHPDRSSENNVAPAMQQPIAQTSISQQYAEKPSSSDQNSGAIYDTSSYHKSLVRQPKKKSGWLWVLWISILLIVGAGAGVAVYFFVLPH